MSETPLPTILPPSVQAKLDRGEPMTVVCPAGEPAQNRHNGRQGVFCKIERQMLTLAGSPLAVAVLCCDAYHTCPTWQKDQDDQSAVERQHKVVDQRVQERITEDHIEHGVRFDDREERKHAKWMEEELRRQESEPLPDDEAARGQGQILLPPGFKRDEEDALEDLERDKTYHEEEHDGPDQHS